LETAVKTGTMLAYWVKSCPLPATFDDIYDSIDTDGDGHDRRGRSQNCGIVHEPGLKNHRLRLQKASVSIIKKPGQKAREKKVDNGDSPTRFSMKLGWKI